MIRPGRDADAPGYRALIAACWGEYPGVVCDFEAEMPEIDALASHMAARGGALWTAELGGVVAGMVAAYPASDGWHLARLYVAATQRGTGLAAALAGCAQAHAKAAGAGEMVLWTDMLFTRAHAFYENNGFVRRGGLRSLQDLSNSIEARYWKPLTGRVVQTLDVAAAESAQRALAALLQACADAGTATPLLPPVSRDSARHYWRGVTQSVGRAEAALLMAWRDGTVAGSLQLAWTAEATGQHRACLHGLLVAPGDRCRGIARSLLTAAESAARANGRSLLVAAAPVDAHSQTFYSGLGWSEAGMVPGYWRGPAGDMQLYHKQLDAGPA